MIEVEKKYNVSLETFKIVEAKLLEMGDFLDEAEEQNTLYAKSGQPLDEVYRIRTLHSISGIKATRFTFKRKIDNVDGLKRYTELEFSVDKKLFEEFLTVGLGLIPFLSYEKKRQEFHISNSVVCLDVLPFGYFVEIEGTKENIQYLEKLLELEDSVEEKTYPQLTKDFGNMKSGIYVATF